MHWIQAIELWIRHFATVVPLEIFVFITSFLEEVIGPIPSMLVMTTAGAFAHLEGRTELFVVWLVLVGNLGKLLGASIYYAIGDKLEDFVMLRFGRFLGITHADVENIGKRFSGNHWKDGGTLFLLRIVPFFPTTIISIASGMIKINRKVFLVATYTGNILKDMVYAFSGYTGLRIIYRFFLDVERIRWGIGILILIGVLVALFLLYINRHHGLRFFEYLRKRLRTK